MIRFASVTLASRGLDAIAVEIAAETSGHAVVVSGTAVVIAMSGLFLAQDAIFSSLAVGSILVVAVAVITVSLLHRMEVTLFRPEKRGLA